MYRLFLEAIALPWGTSRQFLCCLSLASSSKKTASCTSLWKCTNRFSRIPLSKVDRFTSSQDQNDQRPILLILSSTHRQRKCLVFL